MEIICIEKSWALPIVAGRESMTGRDNVKSEAFTMESGDLGVLMADAYTEEDARILSTACYFASNEAEGPEEGMALFGSVSEGIKTDYNWDQCFGNLEDVDNLLRLAHLFSLGVAHRVQNILTASLTLAFSSLLVCEFGYLSCWALYY
jgi:hypothetical protein